MRRLTEPMHDPAHPMVSILVFNYNYGRYLRECIDSILGQTYPNIEICFSDNASSDDSWQIAMSYHREYPGIFNIARNRLNFGPHANLANCAFPKRGKYHLQLCSDDMLEPEYIARCVDVLEAHPACAFVMVNRSIIDPDGNLTPEAPFYDRSCIIPGHGQAEVYMMAAVNPSVSQIMYVSRKSAVHGKDVARELAGRWYGTRLLDFHLCCNYPVAYIKDALLRHRLHDENDSLKAAGNLLEILGPYVLNQQFAETAGTYGLAGVRARLPESVEKLGKLCLRYCGKFLIAGDEATGERYFHLSTALFPGIKSEPSHTFISAYWEGSATTRSTILGKLKSEQNFISRQVSYSPPEGSINLP